jgi:predicted amidohydrolase
LYQKLSELGADIITVPSAFTRVTGKVHWQTLLQARAIENQVYIIAAGQEGVHANGRETWGHSMIISPWGEILACLDQGEGIITSDFIPLEIQRIRTSMPLKHALISN